MRLNSKTALTAMLAGIALATTAVAQDQPKPDEPADKKPAPEKADQPEPAEPKGKRKPKAKPEPRQNERPNQGRPPQNQPPQNQPQPRQGTIRILRAEKQAFLGVATTPLDASLQAQLDLDPGFGLLVRHIEPDSPADKKLKTHDVLVAFEDQKLINQDQLAVLVRGAGKDEKVKLTVFRGGKKEEVEITLAEREVPVHQGPMIGGGPEWFSGPGRGQAFQPAPFEIQIPMPGQRGPGGQPRGFDPQQVEREMREMREKMERWMRDQNQQWQRPPRQPQPQVQPRPGGPGAGVNVRIERRTDANSGPNSDAKSFSSSSTMRKATWVENGVVMTFTDDGQNKTLTVDKDGKRIFDGPINTDEQYEKVPKEVRDSVERFLKKTDSGPKPPAAAGQGGGQIF